MEFKKFNINALKHADYNPRKDLKPGDAEFEKIRNSISEFGYVEPIIVNSDMTIVGGHQRAKVLKELGYQEADCVVIDIDKTKEKALNVALNKISGDWDMESLAKLLDELKGKDFNIEFTGFDFSEAEKLWDEFMPKDDKKEEDEIPDVPDKPVIQLGDIILLGKHRLICGDSTKSEDLARLMNGRKAKLTVTDPPYGISYVGKTKDSLTIQNDNLDDEEFYNFLLSAFKRIYEISDEGASFYVFHADAKGLIFRRAFIDSGFKHSQCCIWVKNTFVMGRQPYQWQHEPAIFGWKPTGSHYWNSDRKQSTIWNFDKPRTNDVHPTMKPVPLIEYIIKNSSKYGDIVLDTFLGSGTTLIAADNVDRICFGAELDPKYCQVIIERWINYKDGINCDDVIIERDGEQYKFSDLKNEQVVEAS
ncbi:DNA modification methylase [Desulfotomaculum arcticum]|uniref:Methyltransferase n=1 Tax=Desulfotruncus arcticus DSM 17038 TaxID=1121424 RepID=A0A1I2ZXS8_9FIRM|nr:site-specific DNA-methyltransferase [Desulfotruncus arcticus]SFH41851.1 DNA modification methylase [Desulfotomaculum arcticum] [Desulfotruncus arcticus DSM 17038]